MKRHSTILAPGLVLLAAVLSGGWFLQTGVSRERNVYHQVRLFEEVMGHVVQSFVDPVDRDLLYRSAVRGILTELGDPNTSFIPASTAEDLRIRMEGEYGGVGLEVILREGWTTVVTALPGTPGTRAGVRPGDQIVEVSGEPTDGWPIDDVVDALRGPPGTGVDVRVRRPGVEEPIPFTIMRAVIQLKSVPFALEIREGVGYLPLQSLTETSFQEVRQAVDSLRSEGVRDLILDLRGNTGGLLDQGIAVTDFFLEPGRVVVETKGRARNQSDTYGSSRRQPHPDLRVVAIVDERSASAAEIIAGALQDHDRAVVVGAPTFGKGSVQTLFPLSGGNILRLTTARWYTPLGRSIHKEREQQIAALERSRLTLEGTLATLPDTEAKPAFLTEGGRTVFGGGGIIPDLLVMADTLTLDERRAIQELDQSGSRFVEAVFNYAVLYLQHHPELDPDFALGAQDLADFQDLLRESDVRLSPSAYRRVERFVRYQLEREISLTAWGEAGEFRRKARWDRMLQRTLELLEETDSAQELLAAASEPERSDWMPREATADETEESGSIPSTDEVDGAES